MKRNIKALVASIPEETRELNEVVIKFRSTGHVGHMLLSIYRLLDFSSQLHMHCSQPSRTKGEGIALGKENNAKRLVKNKSPLR